MLSSVNYKVNCETRDTSQVIHVDRMRPVRSQVLTGEDENKRVHVPTQTRKTMIEQKQIA